MLTESVLVVSSRWEVLCDGNGADVMLGDVHLDFDFFFCDTHSLTVTLWLTVVVELVL